MPTTVPAENASGVVFRTRRATRTDAPPVRRCLVRMAKIEMMGARPEQVKESEEGCDYVGCWEEKGNRAI